MRRRVSQGAATRVLGVIGKPISHSRSPVLHNAALNAVGEDIVYVPLLVDDLPDFLASPLFGRTDFAGFSVTIPHKEVALRCCAEVRAPPRWHSVLHSADARCRSRRLTPWPSASVL